MLDNYIKFALEGIIRHRDRPPYVECDYMHWWQIIEEIEKIEKREFQYVRGEDFTKQKKRRATYYEQNQTRICSMFKEGGKFGNKPCERKYCNKYIKFHIKSLRKG